MDQHAGIRRRHQACFLQQFDHAPAAADDLLAPGIAIVAVSCRRRQCQRLANLRQQRLAVKGLGQVSEDTTVAVAATASGMVPCAVSRITGSAGYRAQLVEKRQAIAPRQPDIAQHQVRPLDGDMRQGRFSRIDG